MPAANPGSGSTLFEGYTVISGPYGDATGYGGDCALMLAGGTINAGDAVYQSAANTVSQGVTANNALRVGVAVGGKQTRGRCYPEVKRGALVALVSDWVIVLFSGKARGISDGVVAVGDKLAFGATAGRVITTAAAAGTQLGFSLSASAGAGNELDILVAPA